MAMRASSIEPSISAHVGEAPAIVCALQVAGWQAVVGHEQSFARVCNMQAAGGAVAAAVARGRCGPGGIPHLAVYISAIRLSFRAQGFAVARRPTQEKKRRCIYLPL